MTSLEKTIGVKKVLCKMCTYEECEECEFFNPEDETDGIHWCGIRDKEGNIPCYQGWDMNSAMISN